MPKIACVFGASGFVGPYLTKELSSHGYKVYPFSRKDINILNYEAVHSMIREIKPDYIFHLAAIAYVPTSWQDPRLVFDVNTCGTLNLLEAVRSNQIDPIIHLACSSEEYGFVRPEETPINEENQLRPLSPYAVSKVAMDLLGYQYFKSYKTKVIRTRAFNHEGAGRPKQYMPSGFAYQVAMMEKGKQNLVIKHGNLDAKRDISDVRDIVRAYRLAVEKGEPGEVYNIGSGVAYSAKDIIEKLFKISGLSTIELQPELQRMRPSDVPLLLCDPTKFKEKTGYKPKYSIEDTLKSELQYWRKNV